LTTKKITKESIELSQSLKETQELEEESHRDYVSFAKDSSVSNKSSAYSSIQNNKARKTSKSNIKKFLDNPTDNYLQLQQSSQYLKNTNGIYNRLIFYFSSLLTYEHYLYPVVSSDKLDNDKKVTKVYEDVAINLEKYNLKFNLPKFTEYIFTDGEVFLYKLEDTKGIVFKKIPNEYCRVSQMEDGVFRYEINVTKFTDITIQEFPQEFQNLYNVFHDKEKSDKNKKQNKNQNNILNNINNNYINYGWFQISNKGVCFPTQWNNFHSFPMMSYLLPDIMDIDSIKDLKKDSDRLDNTKFIHSKVETNKDTGLPVMDLDIVKAYNKSIQDKLPDGMVAITNPFVTNSIQLAGSQSNINNIVEQATDYIYSSAGVSDLLFSNKKSSSEALKQSIAVDVQILLSFILPLYINYINFELRQYNSVYRFAVRILETTLLSRKDDLTLSMASMNVGGSRLKFMALCGHTPIEARTLRKLENALGMDELLTPKLNGNVISGNADGTSNVGGAPTAESTGTVGDNTEKANENK